MRRGTMMGDLAIALVAVLIMVSAGMGIWADAALPSGTMIAVAVETR